MHIYRSSIEVDPTTWSPPAGLVAPSHYLSWEHLLQFQTGLSLRPLPQCGWITPLHSDFGSCWNLLSTTHVSVSRAKHRMNQLWNGLALGDSVAMATWTKSMLAQRAYVPNELSLLLCIHRTMPVDNAETFLWIPGRWTRAGNGLPPHSKPQAELVALSGRQ